MELKFYIKSTILENPQGLVHLWSEIEQTYYSK